MNCELEGWFGWDDYKKSHLAADFDFTRSPVRTLRITFVVIILTRVILLIHLRCGYNYGGFNYGGYNYGNYLSAVVKNLATTYEPNHRYHFLILYHKIPTFNGLNKFKMLTWKQYLHWDSLDSLSLHCWGMRCSHSDEYDILRSDLMISWHIFLVIRKLIN